MNNLSSISAGEEAVFVSLTELPAVIFGVEELLLLFSQ